jgi:pimeloyl-ACP methyl ester carboxylesterase
VPAAAGSVFGYNTRMDKNASRPLWFRLTRRVLVLVVVTYVVWLGALLALESGLVYPRQMTGPAMQESLIPGEVERVWLERDGARVEAWFLPSQSVRPMPAVIFFHGNAELIDHNLGLAEAYRDRGFSTLLVEYRGYGRSGGSPSQKAIVGDAVAAFDWLKGKAGVDPARIIVHGRSLGSGVAAQLAKERPPAALILESPMKSVASFASAYGAPAFLVRNPYRTDKVLPGLTCPILLVHSREDEIIPFAHAEELKRLAPAARLVELTGGHNDSLTNQGAYWEAIDGVVREVSR